MSYYRENKRSKGPCPLAYVHPVDNSTWNKDEERRWCSVFPSRTHLVYVYVCVVKLNMFFLFIVQIVHPSGTLSLLSLSMSCSFFLFFPCALSWPMLIFSKHSQHSKIALTLDRRTVGYPDSIVDDKKSTPPQVDMNPEWEH